MSGVKHTPGRWTAHKTIEAHDGMPECWQIDAEHDAVCTTQFCYAPNTEANARLIAAAPDLLECLMTVRDYVTDGIANADDPNINESQPMRDMMAEDLARIDAAIARARGEQDGGAS